MRWIKASQLEGWAPTPSGRTDFSGLVADLIRASVPDISTIRFPSGDKGQVRGFDGHLECSVGALNVPEGISVWEFGTEKDYQGKANRDFDKRSSETAEATRLETTYVGVTPFTWDSSDKDNKIENWVAEKRALGLWKDVRLIDGSMIETWLEACPAVSAWHAIHTVRVRPLDGIRSTEDFWREFSARYQPALTEEVVLSDRAREAEEIITALAGKRGSTSFSADSPDEVIAFAIAAIRKAKPELRLFLEARTIVIDTMDAGRHMLAESNLIYLLRNDATRTPGMFADKGPTLVPFGRQQKNGSARVLERPSPSAMADAMSTMGYERHEALNLARGSGRSLTALARQIPSGTCEPPEWMKEAPLVLPAILAGAWEATNTLDKNVLAYLANTKDYPSYEARIRTFLVQPDPPLEQEGQVWKVRAPMDAFVHAGHLIGAEHLPLLREILTEVFSKVSEVPASGSFFKKPGEETEHSEWLKDGLATTLLLIAVWQKQGGINLSDGEGQRFADDVIANLPGLSTNHKLLASLRGQLPLLAEAAPSPLLSALELMLEGKAERIRPIFDEIDGFMYKSSHHTGLLWALETIAWDPDYFIRAVQALAKLAAIDPGGNLTNRPINSLTEIFLPWHPGTNASVAERLLALDAVVAVSEDVGWTLLKRMLPSNHSVSTPTARPKLREGGVANRGPVTYQEMWKLHSEVITRMLRIAGNDIQRWKSLVRRFGDLSPDDQSRVRDKLDNTMAGLSASDQAELWLSINEQIARHERFATAQWALPPAHLAPWRALSAKYEPSDPLSKIRWLFDEWWIETDGDQRKYSEERAAAVRKIYGENGALGLLTLVKSVKIPHFVAETVQAMNLSARELETILLESMKEIGHESFTANIAYMFEQALGADAAERWLHKTILSRDNGETDAIEILLSWPHTLEVWSIVERLGGDIADTYWRRKEPLWSKAPSSELEYIMRQYLRIGRPMAAIKSALNRLRDVPTPLLFQCLDEAVTELNSSSEKISSNLTYEIEKVFTNLDTRNDASEQDIATREMAYLPLFRHGNRPLRLHELMARDPDTYFALLSPIFRAEGEERRELSAQESNALNARYQLVSEFDRVPGTVDGAIDHAFLASWIDRVLHLGAESKKSEIIQQYVGHVLAHSVADEDGAWPHRAVRDEIERLASVQVERGIQIERFNMRGVTMRAMYEGGEQERSLAEQYKNYAAKAEAWPRTYKLLVTIAKDWEAQAAHEDTRAAQQKMKS